MSKASEHAYQFIRQRVLSGALPPGAQVKEEELAELCGVSRTPVREAIKRLESEMYLSRSGANRTFVSDWTMDDLAEIFTLRAMLEGYAAARAAERVDATVIAELRRINDAVRDAIRRPVPDVAAFYALNATYHRLIVETAGSDRLGGMLNRVLYQPIVQRTALHYERDELEQSHREHEELVGALAAGDPEWARAVMTAHIRRAFHIYASRIAPAESGAA